MKHFIFFCFILFRPAIGAAQQFVDPDTIQQSGDIILQNTDVYYKPFAPPASTDTRAQLSNQAAYLRDSNGVVPPFPFNSYAPMTHDTILASWHPSASWPDTLGPNVVWQRLFTAKRKPNGQTSDIIVGSNVTNDTLHTNGHHGQVIIGKNEDVDFRASGRVILKSGFHAKPGCFFHAYTEPHWSGEVFHEEFDSSLDKWYVANGHGEGGGGLDASHDTNATLVSDTDAHDGHALDIAIHLDTVNRFLSYELEAVRLRDSCNGGLQNPPDSGLYLFSTAKLRACPWPYTQRLDTPLVPAYQHAPYGKYEIREKIPLTPHHTNNWLDAFTEFDMNEGFQNYTGLMTTVNPDIYRDSWHGPFKGKFHKKSDGAVVFVSAPATWSLTNNPKTLYIDNFPYQVSFDTGRVKDSVVATGGRTALMGHGGWPYSLSNSTDSITFYYARQEANTADSLTWTVDTIGGKWRKFSAPYHGSHRFTKDYQPSSITLTYDIFGRKRTYNCHWEYNLNHPTDSGLIYLDDTMGPLDLHINTEKYPYTVNEMSAAYPIPGVAFDSTHYKYHTFGLEVLPHEVRFLVDSNVVRRIPDRMVPSNSRQYDYASQIDRAPLDLRIAEVDYEYDMLDTNNVKFIDSFGTYSNSYFWPDSVHGRRYWSSVMYLARQYFEQRISNSADGFWNNAAHHRVDYVKIWDVPSDMYIPGFPQ